MQTKARSDNTSAIVQRIADIKKLPENSNNTLHDEKSLQSNSFEDQDCIEQYGFVPVGEGIIKDSLMRFMAGNVL